MSNKDYNVYNTYDDNFINYANLYKTPREMNSNSEELIGDYADALIKGPSDVYVNSPELVGNRYFIDTNTRCLDKNDNTKTHNRSILVDNVMTSAMGTAKDGNRGLIYSLIASMKTLNSNAMFDMSNNEPISHDKYNPTGYLSNIDMKPMPVCEEVSVYAKDNENEVISGWLTDDDREMVDPKAIEGFMGAPPLTVSGDMTANEFGSGMEKQQTVVQEHAKAAQNAQKSATDSAKENAQSAIKKSQDSASKHGQNAKSNMKNFAEKNKKEQRSRAEAAKAEGSDQQLRAKTEEYLTTPKPIGASNMPFGDKATVSETNNNSSETNNNSSEPPVIEYGLVTELLNVTFRCGPPGSSKMRRIPYECIDAIGEQFTNVSIDIGKNDNALDLCDEEKSEVSVSGFFKGLSQCLKDNAFNEDAKLTTKDIKGTPSSIVKVRLSLTAHQNNQFLFSSGQRRTTTTCVDKPNPIYDKLYEKLNTLCRKDFARLIVRYRGVGAFGQCKAVADKNPSDIETEPCCECENFEPMLSGSPKKPLSFGFLDVTSIFYLIVLLFLMVFIIYRFMVRIFSFDKGLSFRPLRKVKTK